MKWLITGADGFVGQALLNAVLARNDEDQVIALDLGAIDLSGIPNTPGTRSRVTALPMDVLDAVRLNRLFEEQKPDFVLHAAALTPGADAEAALEEKTIRVNLGGSVNVLRAALATRPRHVVLFSSAGVYDPNAKMVGPITEASPCRPHNAYAASKLAVETLAASFASDLMVTIVRPGPIYGPTEKLRVSRPNLSLIGMMAEALVSEERFTISTPDASRSWCHADDAAEAVLALALRAPNKSAEIFNIAGAKPLSNRQIAHAFVQHGLHLDWRSRAPLPREANKNSIDISRLREATGFVPSRDIETAIPSLVRKHGDQNQVH